MTQRWRLILPASPKIYTAIMAGESIPCYAVNSQADIFPFFLNSRRDKNAILSVDHVNNLSIGKIPLLSTAETIFWWLVAVFIFLVLVVIVVPAVIIYTNSVRVLL